MFNAVQDNFKICAMFVLKYFLVVFLVLIGGGSSISSKSENQTAEILWKLSNFALQSRQNHRKYPYPYSYKYPGKYPQYYQNYPINSYSQYPGSAYPTPHDGRPYSYYEKVPYPYDYLSKPTIHTNRPFGHTPETVRQSFMDVLFSIARNDDLQCVPKVICEVTSGAMSGRQQGVNLPININMESILGFFSALNGIQSSPLLYFGKAALQGYASKGNTGSCSYAYPDCPSDPDKLVQYLNNHNGGFFRYFNGVNPQYPRQHQHQFYNPSLAVQQRIQTSPIDYDGSNFRQQKGIQFPLRDDDDIIPSSGQSQLKFPSEEDPYNNEVRPDNGFLYKPQNSLKFPSEETFANYQEQPFRKPKELPYDISYYYPDNELDLQKPLPNHKATPLIFPTRTGTGELRLDPEELEGNRQPLSYQDDDVKITFNGYNDGTVKDQIRFTNNNLETFNYGKIGRGFAFPSR